MHGISYAFPLYFRGGKEYDGKADIFIIVIKKVTGVTENRPLSSFNVEKPLIFKEK